MVQYDFIHAIPFYSCDILRIGQTLNVPQYTLVMQQHLRHRHLTASHPHFLAVKHNLLVGLLLRVERGQTHRAVNYQLPLTLYWPTLSLSFRTANRGGILELDFITHKRHHMDTIY